MIKKFYIKRDGENGYYTEKSNSFIDPDTLEWCKFCAHGGCWVNQSVCVNDNALNILLHGIKIVAQNGHCNRFKVADENNHEQYSKIKSKILKSYCIEMNRGCK